MVGYRTVEYGPWRGCMRRARSSRICLVKLGGNRRDEVGQPGTSSLSTTARRGKSRAGGTQVCLHCSSTASTTHALVSRSDAGPNSVRRFRPSRVRTAIRDRETSSSSRSHARACCKLPDHVSQASCDTYSCTVIPELIIFHLLDTPPIAFPTGAKPPSARKVIASRNPLQ